MKTSAVDMGQKKMGEFIYSKNVVQYTLSPFEQKAFANVLVNGPVNIWRRMRAKALISLPPLYMCYWLVNHTKTEHARISRKNPAEFENETFEEM